MTALDGMVVSEKKKPKSRRPVGDTSFQFRRCPLFLPFFHRPVKSQMLSKTEGGVYKGPTWWKTRVDYSSKQKNPNKKQVLSLVQDISAGGTLKEHDSRYTPPMFAAH
ncbi:hypothetical protein V6N13_045272 [Hibiscus sabdariffa]|uniref:Uncharacterized protein n=1 Tax=Hibiscus sabdariffa TaxID=183260 RepID=A0ABR2RKL2_9ROSI